MNTEDKNPNELDVYNEGRKAVTVTMNDDEKEECTVRKIGLDTISQWSAKPPTQWQKALAYLEGKDEQWLKRVSPEGQLAIVLAGGELMRPLLRAFADQEKLDAKAWGRDLDKMMQNAVTMVMLAQQDPQLMEILKDGAQSSESSDDSDTP